VCCLEYFVQSNIAILAVAAGVAAGVVVCVAIVEFTETDGSSSIIANDATIK
jgi:O-antigen ligase